MAVQGFFTGDVKIRNLNGVLKAVNGIVEVATDIGTVTGSGTTGYVPKWSSTTAIGDSLMYDAGSAILIGSTTAGSGKLMVYSSTPDNHYQAIGSAPSFRFADTIVSPSYTGIIGLATATNHFIIGAVAGDMVLANNTTSSIGNFIFGTGATERMRITPTGNVSIGGTGNTYKLDVTGTGRFSGQLRLESTITNGTYTYTLPGATGTIALVGGAGVGTVTSVGLTMPSAFAVSSSPVTGSGTIAVTGAGIASQYIRGDGTLANFPTSGGGGGASVSYYLNGSVNQGTFGGVTYYEMNKTPIIGAGTDFTINANGYIASFLTDAGDPALLNIPAGNWNFEMFFSASSGGGTPSFYVELYKYDGTTFTLISSGSATPESITNGTAIDLYTTALTVPSTTLTLTDRLAIRIYVTHSGRTITLHTEDNHLCQVITTFTTGLTALNGLTAQVQYLATGTSGTDFNIASATATHTFNLPTASAINRGALSSADWTTFNNKQNALTNPITGTGTSGQVAYFNGTNSITSNAAFAFTPTSQLLVNNSVTAASAIARGTNLTPALIASANSDVLVGLDINPTFTNGAFTGVQNLPLRITLNNSKTSTNTSFVNLFKTNDVSNGQSISLSYIGNATLANRSFIYQTAEDGVAFGGNITFQNNGGRVLIGSNTVFNTANTFEVTGASRINGTLLLGTQSLGSGLYWDNINSRLGIGLSGNPSYKLQITNNLSGITGVFSNGVNADFLIDLTSGVSLLTTGTGALSLGATSTEGLRMFASTRNIVIQNGGTLTDAGFRLDVNGTARVQGVITGSVGSGSLTLGAASANNVAIAVTGYFSSAGAISTSNANARSFNTNIGGQDRGITVGYNGNAQGQTVANIYFSAGGNINLTDGAIDLNGFNFGPTIVSATGATIKAFSSNLPAATNRWNLFMIGTASNYLEGDTAIGTTTLGTATKFTLGGSETASSAIARGQLLNTTLVAAANNDVLVGLDINPTFTNGAFTGVSNTALRVTGNTSITGNTTITDGTNTITISPSTSASGIAINQARPGLILNRSGTNLFQIYDFNNNGAFTALKAFSNFGGTGILLIANNDSSRNITLYNSGNVGINTTLTDSGFKLDVNGTARVSGLITGSDGATFGNTVNITRGFSTATFNVGDGGTTNSSTIRIIKNATGNAANLYFRNVSTDFTRLWLNASNNFEIANQSTSGLFATFFSSSNNIGIGTGTDVASSILTIESTTKGFLPPRGTNAQRNAIASPAIGLVFYCTDSVEGLYIYTASGWRSLTMV